MTMYEDGECLYESGESENEKHPLKDVTNGYSRTSIDFRMTKCRRLSDPDHSGEVSLTTTLPQLDSTILAALPEDSHSVSELCEKLNSVDMCTNNDVSISPCKKATEAEKVRKSAEVLFAYEKDKDGDTILHNAIILLESTLALRLIDIAPSPAFVSMNNFISQTPLHLAVLTNLSDVVRRLMVAGTEIDSRNQEGNTPLHLACRDGRLQIVQHLLEPVRYQETKQNKYEIPYQKIPQDLSIRNYEGQTVLHLAALNNHLDVVELLLEKHININLQEGKAGRTILHCACNLGNIKLVRLLLRHRSCNINARAYDGSTAFDLARDGDHDLVCMTLAAEGARHGEGDFSDSD